jgi:hypothetical protein
VTVGLGVVATVGREVGSGVGLLGTFEGIGDGKVVGDGVGCAVGWFEGLVDGCEVGFREGFAVGSRLGLWLGFEVGNGEGGVGVGSKVAQNSSAQHRTL